MTTSVTPAGYIGDFNPGDTIYFAFNTHQTSHAPHALASGAIKTYQGATTTEDDSGPTLVVDFDSVVGLNVVTLDTSSDGTFFASGRTFHVYLSAGTVNSVSVAGMVVARFTLGLGQNVTRLGGVAQSLTDLKDFADTGYDPATHNVAEVDSVAALGTQAKADVNGELVDVMNVDTWAAPAQGAPASTTTFRLMLAYLYKSWRNKKTQSATEWDLYNDDAATVDHKATVSDSGTVATKGEIASGP